MSSENRHSVDAAARAGRLDRLAEWVTEFLSSPGSDNGALALKLCDELGWWVGPVQLPIGRLQRLAGPPTDPVAVTAEPGHWYERVASMREVVEGGWEPPPVIVSLRGDRLLVEDGNHRVESLRRAGRRKVWAVVGFESREHSVRFVEEYASHAAAD